MTEQGPDQHSTARTAPRGEGKPTWIDVSVPDLKAGQDFYGRLFGWEFQDQGEDYGHYHLVQQGGATIGGMMGPMPTTDGTDPAAIPPTWTIYLETADLEGRHADVLEAGGQSLAAPMDVGELGRMAIVADPAGAVLGLWQPGEYGGFDLPLTTGTPVWFESLTTGFDRALAFYRDVLGWDISWMGGEEGGGDGGVRYVTHGAGDAAVAGLCDASDWLPEGAPSFWRVYFSVEDTDRALERIRELGGELVDGPMDSPFGRLATVRDPFGAMFQIIQPPEGQPRP